MDTGGKDFKAHFFFPNFKIRPEFSSAIALFLGYTITCSGTGLSLRILERTNIMKMNLRTVFVIWVLLISRSTVRANPYHELQEGNGRIAFVSNRGGNYEIYSMNYDGSDVIRLTYDEAKDLVPDWSPDGTKIAFESYRNAQPADIYVMNADGSNVTNLTNSPSNSDTDPSWSPDGTRIAFSRYTGPAADLYVMNSDGSGLLKIVDGGGQTYNLMPTWSPDGSEIMFTSGKSEDLPGPTSAIGALTIHKVNIDGSGETRISAGYVSTYGNLDWSWVNNKIAFYDVAAVGKAIFTMDSTITNIVKVTPNNNDENQIQLYKNPSWSPDGSKIAYESTVFRPGPTSDIYVVNIATGVMTNITNDPDADDTSPDWGRIFTVPSPIPTEA